MGCLWLRVEVRLMTEDFIPVRVGNSSSITGEDAIPSGQRQETTGERQMTGCWSHWQVANNMICKETTHKQFVDH